jgi:glycosyltransferase involved in cell wall biosynthesis
MRILEVSCSYFPDKIGGTETYVRYLAKGLTGKGHDICVCYVQDTPCLHAPFFKITNYTHDGIPVYVLEKNTVQSGTSDIYFQKEKRIRFCFSQLLDQVKPEIVHFHHLSSTDIIDAVEIAKERGLPVLLTYHTPMMTCCQGQMLYSGISPCAGKIEFHKCLECAQVAYSVPRFLAKTWARLPQFFARPLGRFISRFKLKSPLATWLQLPWMEFERVKRLRQGLGLFDYFIAVSEWVRSLLLTNGVLPEKILLLRQGVEVVPEKKVHAPHQPLNAVFIGRIVPYKGLDILFKALALMDETLSIEVDVYGVPQDHREEAYLRTLRKKYSSDKRIKWKGLLEPDKKFDVLARADVVVIPSLWQETGPLVLLEAWAAGVPVIGSRRGSIAELMADGRGGLLFEPGDFRELANVLSRVVEDHGVLEELAKTIPAPRTMEDVVLEMESVYMDISSKRAAGL